MQILSVKKLSRFSLYTQKEGKEPKPKKVPAFPTWNGDLITYKRKKKYYIGETVPGRELTWFVVKYENGDEVWICDRNLVNRVSRNMLTEFNGIRFDVEGIRGKLSLPKMGLSENDECEWMDLVRFLGGDEENNLHWQKCHSFGVERYPAHTGGANKIVLRGYSSPQHWERANAETMYDCVGWRPVIRIAKPEAVREEAGKK